MDVIFSVAMASEPPNNEILNRKPYNPNDNLLSKV